MTPSTSAAVNGWSGFDGPKPLASWYAEGLCDGLGDRLAMFDNSGTPSLELLRSRPMLASVIAFEESLRRRVDELRSFDHPAFSRIRAVERMESGDLALVSTFTKGKRVAEIFWSPEARTGVHPAFAAWLIREVTSGVAELHRRGGDIAHAAVSPDHIVLTPDGHVVIVEHVLGAALDRVCLPVGRLRQLLGASSRENMTTGERGWTSGRTSFRSAGPHSRCFSAAACLLSTTRTEWTGSSTNSSPPPKDDRLRSCPRCAGGSNARSR